MRENIRLLQAEIQADLGDIEKAYEALASASGRIAEPEMDVVVGYYLQVMYGLFENLFQRIATAFENQITDEARWHAQLLRRMTLDVKKVRPRVISEETYECLDELRRFRHLFRNAYVLSFDVERLALVLKKAQRLAQLYRADLDEFSRFLDDLAGEGAEGLPLA
jgi:hypothetical protein